MKNIRKEIEELRKKGFKGYVAYEKPNAQCSKDWTLYEKRGTSVQMTCYGRQNVEKRISEIKSEMK